MSRLRRQINALNRAARAVANPSPQGRWTKSPWGERLVGWGVTAEVATPAPYIADARWKWRVFKGSDSTSVLAFGDAATKREARRNALAAMKRVDRA